MKMDSCEHKWDHTVDEYLPIAESIKRHHPCKDCGLINNHHEADQMKTGKLIMLIKELLEKNGVPRSSIRGHTDNIKKMKQKGLADKAIVHLVMSDVLGRSYMVDIRQVMR